MWTPRIQALLMRLPARRFEVLLGNVFVGWEFDEIAVTPMSGDGGVDFVGRVGLGRRPLEPSAVTGASLFGGRSAYVFGQAKRYSMAHPVEVNAIDALLGAAVGFLRGGGTPVKNRMIRKLTEWGWNASSPLMSAFATSGWFRSSIPGYAHQQGFTIFDGEQLAQRVVRLTPSLRTWTEAQRAVTHLSSEPQDHVTLLE